MSKIASCIFIKVLTFLWCAILYSCMHTFVEDFFFCKFKAASLALCNAFACHQSIQAITSLSFFALWIVSIFTSFRNRTFATKRFLGDVVCIEFLQLAQSGWTTPNSGFGEISLFDFISFVLMLDLLYCGLRYLAYQRVEPCRGAQGSFVVDDYDVGNIDEVRRRYLETFVDRLDKVDNSEESFAVAIYGDWGSGKTLFLRSLESYLKERNAIVVNFNPWDCNSSKLMLGSFFEALRVVLVDYHASLKKSIVKYSDMLTELDVPHPFLYISSLFKSDVDNIDDVKIQISNALRDLQTDVYVIIDDIDRLSSDEIFDVVRLIRNTANFPYIKFIVASDYKYLIGQLDKINIKESYLQKIFSLDLTLPNLFADYPYANRCREAVMEMTNDVVLQNYWEVMTTNVSEVMDEALGNLRQANRFARQLVLNWSFAQSNVSGKQTEIVVSEFVLMELLKISDTVLYDDLRLSPDKYFDVKQNTQYNQSMYILKNEEDLAKYGCKDSSLSIIRYLFSYSAYAKMNHNSIVLLENFDKYFSFGKVYGHISKTDFLALLNSLDNNETFEKKIDDMSYKEFQSLYNLLMMLDVTKLQIQQKKRVIDILLTKRLAMQSDKFDKLIDKDLFSVLKASSKQDSVRDYLVDSLSHTGGIYQKMLLSNRVSNMIFKRELEKGEELLSNAQLKGIMVANFNTYVSSYKCDASDILRVESLLSQLVAETIVCYPLFDEEGDYECDGYKGVMIDEVIQYFEQHKSNNLNAIKEFETIDDDASFPQEYLDSLQEKKQQEILGLFGSEAKYKEFINKCFVQAN